jgi:catechol 2,3-dioxygenase-like lactoylglutathione lyase family enzyme
MTTLVTAEPQLYVRDIAASLGFYCRTLGFSVAFTHGAPPFYGQVFRDGARLNLRHAPQQIDVVEASFGLVDPSRASAL